MAKKIAAGKTDYPFKNINNLLNRVANFKNFPPSKKFYLLLLVLGITLVVIFKKSWFIAATVNGMPVTNLELQSRLNQQFRVQVLNQLINEKILLLEVGRSGSIPQDPEVASKIKELETQVGGKEALDTLLSQQGQTRIALRDQVKLQLMVAKLYDKEATVSADEVSQFLEQNKQLLSATDSASQQQEAYDLLKQQKLSQIFSQKFQELRQKTKITIF